MKKSLSLLLALLMCMTLVLPAHASWINPDAIRPGSNYVEETTDTPAEEIPAEQPEESPSMTDAQLYAMFPDVTGHWGTNAIRDCVEYGLFSGTTATTFSPEQTLTGAMFVTVLARLSGIDTTVGDAYTVSLDWASYQELIDDSFVPDKPILRQEIAAIFYRYVNLFLQDTEDGVGDPYTAALTGLFNAAPDYADIDPDAVNAMHWTYASAILTGDGGTGRLRPKDQATRAEAAALLVRFIDACDIPVERKVLTLPDVPAEETPAVSSDNTIVLLYHELTYDEALAASQPTLYVTVDEFRQQLETLLALGYTSISLEDLYQGKNEPGKNYFVVTFDDGYISNYTFGFPILRELGVYADIFINTDNIVLSHHFNYEQAQEMEDSGYVRIYSHFPTHQDLRTLNRNQFIYEFTRSFESLNTALTAERSYFFAYPYSAYNQDTYQWSLELGVGFQCVQDLSFDAEGIIQRVTVKHGDDMAQVAASAPRN